MCVHFGEGVGGGGGVACTSLLQPYVKFDRRTGSLGTSYALHRAIIMFFFLQNDAYVHKHDHAKTSHDI